VENLILTGAAVNGTGNGLRNDLIGNGLENTLAGKDGADILTGKGGKDTLSGGFGSDTFQFAQQESVASEATADVLTDWSNYDAIDFRIHGWVSNYAELATSAATVEDAAAQAEAADTADVDYIFLFNASSDTGYLLADLNNDETFETGIILTGAGAAANFNYFDIV
jgi:Ca2+-binding RTX toxin-like protein